LFASQPSRLGTSQTRTTPCTIARCPIHCSRVPMGPTHRLPAVSRFFVSCFLFVSVLSLQKSHLQSWYAKTPIVCLQTPGSFASARLAALDLFAGSFLSFIRDCPQVNNNTAFSSFIYSEHLDVVSPSFCVPSISLNQSRSEWDQAIQIVDPALILSHCSSI
jgi:hypothetical protein